MFSSVDAPLRYLLRPRRLATIAQIPTAVVARRLASRRRVVPYEISTISSSVPAEQSPPDLASGGEKTVIEDAAQPAAFPTELAVLAGDGLYSVAFDADTVAPRGEPRLVAPSVQTGANSLISQYATGVTFALLLGQTTSAASHGRNAAYWCPASPDQRSGIIMTFASRPTASVSRTQRGCRSTPTRPTCSCTTCTGM